MNNDSKNSEEKILEGEIVGKIPEKKTRVHREQPKFTPHLSAELFRIPLFAKLRRNCLLAAVSFITLTIAAIYFKNGWLFLLALLLPPWIFSQK